MPYRAARHVDWYDRHIIHCTGHWAVPSSLRRVLWARVLWTQMRVFIQVINVHMPGRPALCSNLCSLCCTVQRSPHKTITSPQFRLSTNIHTRGRASVVTIISACRSRWAPAWRAWRKAPQILQNKRLHSYPCLACGTACWLRSLPASYRAFRPVKEGLIHLKAVAAAHLGLK